MGLALHPQLQLEPVRLSSPTPRASPAADMRESRRPLSRDRQSARASLW